MRIQHNIMAMNAYRNYNTNTSALSKNLEKLSSGYKINRAGDDAAGLAISEKMRAQITGLEGAQQNAKDGISLVQTAEGALTEVHDMLNRMYSLAEQSANGTYDDNNDRAQLQKEVEQLRTEINRISESANFNGIKLLDGSLDSYTIPGGVAPIDDSVYVGVDGVTGATTATKATISFTTGTNAGDTLTINGQNITIDTSDIDALAAITVDTGVTLGDLFNIDVDGTTAGTTTIGTGATVTLTAKNAGALKDSHFSAASGITGAGLAGDVTATNGTSMGQASAATKSEIKLEFDFTQLAGGDTFQIGDKTFEISTNGQAGDGNTIIDLSGLDLADTAGGQVSAAEKIQAAINSAFGTDADVSGTAGAITGNKFTLTITAKIAGAGYNLGEVRVDDTTTGITGTNTKGTDAQDAVRNSFSSVTYDLNLNLLAEGDKLSIGGVELEIVADTATSVAANQIKLSDAQDGDKLSQAFQAAGFTAGNLTIADGKLTITSTTLGEDADTLAAGTGDVIFTDKELPAEDQTVDKGLVLQIGENSETYNQLTVKIKATDAKSIGIGDIDIGSQTGAAAALEDIEKAINYISDVRGTLGATQNRLDHTINNLSVMQENIQDAESTIRDTDVAEEMMAYTKNNILIQSAQAMLAQANQVPQGVLQLLG